MSIASLISALPPLKSEMIALGAFIVATGTLIKAVLEFSLTGRAKRFEIYQKMGERFRANASFRAIAEMCAADDERLRDIVGFDKIAYAEFFEEVGMLVRSKLVHIRVVKAQYGPYIERCAEAKNFWYGRYFDPGDPYWGGFFDIRDRVVAANLRAPSNAF